MRNKASEEKRAHVRVLGRGRRTEHLEKTHIISGASSNHGAAAAAVCTPATVFWDAHIFLASTRIKRFGKPGKKKKKKGTKMDIYSCADVTLW